MTWYTQHHNNKILFTLFITTVCAMYVIGQTSVFTEFNKSDGLPSNFVYRALEDMEGNIWLCTDGGVCKYDGKTMKCFDQTDGLPDKDIYKITLDDIGRIWLLHASNKIAFIQNDSVHVFSTSSLPTTQRQNYSNGGYQGIYIGSDYYLIDGQNNVTLGVNKRSKLNSNDLSWHNLSIQSNKAADTVFVNKYNNGKRIKKMSIPEIKSEVQTINQYHQPSNTFQIYTNNRLYIYDTLFVQQEVLDIQLPHDINILSSIKDSWGNLWICTRNGLFFQSNNQRLHQVTNLEELEGTNIIKVLDHKKGVLIIDDKGGVYRYSSEKLYSISKSELHSGITYNAQVEEDNLFISYGIIGLIKSSITNNNSLELKPINPNSKDFTVADDGSVFVSGNDLVHVKANNEQIKVTSKNLYKKVSYDIQNKNIWVNTNDSLYIISSQNYYPMQKVISFPLIENIKYIGNGKTMITTFDSHIYICNSRDCIEVKLESKVHVTSIKIQKGYLWLNTQNGIYKSEDKIENSTEYSFTSYFNYGSLQNNITVNDILIYDDYILLGTESGVIKINELKINQIKKTIPVDIQYVGTAEVKGTDNFILGYQDRNIELSYNAKYFGNRNELYFDYLLEGNNNDTITTTEEQVRYTDLASGEYVFKVRARDAFGNSSEFKELNIEIKKPWYHRPSIYIMGFLLLGTIGYFIFKFYLSRVNKRNLLQQQFAELELSALQSQMNPHFVFNAMNSIQSLIISDRPEEADLYVTRLARLMRKYLDSTKEKYIRIDEELEIVKIYLQLEELRFGTKISYHIDNTLDAEYLTKRIPATIVQPFVENALKHGLFHKKEKGNLYLRLFSDDSNIFIEIEDDGVGRARVQEIKKRSNRNHKSTGMKSIEKRLEVLRKLDKVDIEYTLVDLYENKLPIGTKVIIRIRNN